jgi:hypothetical protein
MHLRRGYRTVLACFLPSDLVGGQLLSLESPFWVTFHAPSIHRANRRLHSARRAVASPDRTRAPQSEPSICEDPQSFDESLLAQVVPEQFPMNPAANGFRMAIRQVDVHRQSSLSGRGGNDMRYNVVTTCE